MISPETYQIYSIRHSGADLLTVCSSCTLKRIDKKSFDQNIDQIHPISPGDLTAAVLFTLIRTNDGKIGGWGLDFCKVPDFY